MPLCLLYAMNELCNVESSTFFIALRVCCICVHEEEEGFGGIRVTADDCLNTVRL